MSGGRYDIGIDVGKRLVTIKAPIEDSPLALRTTIVVPFRILKGTLAQVLVIESNQEFEHAGGVVAPQAPPTGGAE